MSLYVPNVEPVVIILKLEKSANTLLRTINALFTRQGINSDRGIAAMRMRFHLVMFMSLNSVDIEKKTSRKSPLK